MIEKKIFEGGTKENEKTKTELAQGIRHMYALKMLHLV